MNLSLGNIVRPIRRRLARIKWVFPRRFSFIIIFRRLVDVFKIFGPWGKRVGIAASILLLMAFVTIAAGFSLAWPMPYGKQYQEITIPYASSAREVANQLQARGLIRNANGFVWYIRLTGQTKALRAGVYRLRPGYTLNALVKELESGTPLVYRVTIPEGYTAREIIDLLMSKHLINADRFKSLLQDKVFLERHIQGFAPITSGEGFLFPDTYEFAHGATEEEILTVFFQRFMEVWSEEERLNEHHRDALQILTMASIVEKEAKAREERPIIAGVFYNRLSRRIPLESCATVQYALGKHKEVLYYKDLKVDSPYNTYQRFGLPPGPICNPGRASIEAAMRPASHNYLYFVAKDDGHHLFSTTYRQHLAVQRGLRNKLK